MTDRDNQTTERPEVMLANSIVAVVTEATRESSARLARELAVLTGRVNDTAAEQKDTLSSLNSRLIKLEGQLTQIACRQQQLEYLRQADQEQLSGLIQQMKLLENISRENHLLGEQHYKEHLIGPMVHSLFPIFDIIADGRSCRPHQDDLSTAPEYELIDMVENFLTEFLSTYQITPIRHEPGSMFEPRVMKPVKLVPTDRTNLDRRVAKCLQVGFVYKQETVLRPESVALYRDTCRDRGEDPKM